MMINAQITRNIPGRLISKKNYIYCLLTGALFNYYPGA
jgi:hypothetical protein